MRHLVENAALRNALVQDRKTAACTRRRAVSVLLHQSDACMYVGSLQPKEPSFVMVSRDTSIACYTCHVAMRSAIAQGDQRSPPAAIVDACSAFHKFRVVGVRRKYEVRSRTDRAPIPLDSQARDL